jgi:hypothetical protein
LFCIANHILICRKVPDPEATTSSCTGCNSTAKIFCATILGDIALSLSSLVIGILGLKGDMSPAAAYSLIGVSGTITLAWVAHIVGSKGGAFTLAKAVVLNSTRIFCCGRYSKLMHRRGLEPLTTWFEARYSIRLSYRCEKHQKG